MLDFKPITADNIMETVKFFDHKISRTSDFTIGAMFMWREFYHTHFTIVDNMIIYKVKFLGRTSFTFPTGSGSLDNAIAALKEYCLQTNTQLWFCTAPIEATNILVDNYQGIIPGEPSRDWADYLYRATDLAEMAGRHFSGQRNHMNRFKTLYPEYQYHKITGDNLSRIREFLIDYQERFSKDASLAKEELTRTLEILPFFELFNLIGGFIEVENKIVAISIGEIVNDTLYCHIEKANREYHGSYQMIVKEFAKSNLTINLEYINREEDVGDEGLRTSKLSYHPIALLDKYCVLLS